MDTSCYFNKKGTSQEKRFGHNYVQTSFHVICSKALDSLGFNSSDFQMKRLNSKQILARKMLMFQISFQPLSTLLKTALSRLTL